MENSIFAPKQPASPLISNPTAKATFQVNEPFKPSLYFFYSTLSTPENLKRALRLKSYPEMTRAEVRGYSIGTWGIYAALFKTAPTEKVLGFVYEMKTKEEVESLAVHLTNAYEIVPCIITLKDKADLREVVGNTFVYAGDAKALQEERFDRKLWERVGSKSYHEIRHPRLKSENIENGVPVNLDPYPFRFASSTPVIMRPPPSSHAPTPRMEASNFTLYLQSLRGTMAIDTSPDIAALGVRNTNVDPSQQKTSKWKGDRSLSESEEQNTLPELQSSWMPPELVEKDEELKKLMEGTFKGDSNRSRY